MSLSSPSMSYCIDPMSADHIYQEKYQEETQDNRKGNATLRTARRIRNEVHFISPLCSLNTRV